MKARPITYFDRYTKTLKEESIYGEAALRFTYETVPGRTLANLFFSRPFLSQLFGWWMKRPSSRSRIKPFVEQYGLDKTEFEEALDHFTSFNDFFIRRLKASARPVDPDPRTIVFPADGRHLGWQQLGAEQGVFVKGQRWNLAALLDNDAALMERFAGGSLVLSRLCPVDYHHFHFPVSGHILESRWMGQKLFSVSPIALRRRLGYLWENKRCLTRCGTDGIGEVCFIAVGATNVGSIRFHSLSSGHTFRKGAANGWFEFGGSSVITLFEPGRVDLSPDLRDLTADGMELYAHVGDTMGQVRAT